MRLNDRVMHFVSVEREKPVATAVNGSRCFIVRRSTDNDQPENGRIAAWRHCYAKSRSTWLDRKSSGNGN